MYDFSSYLDTNAVQVGMHRQTDTAVRQTDSAILIYHPFGHKNIWAVSQQNQHNGFATSMDPDQPAHPRSLIRIHAVRYQFLYLLWGL
jgi:hypothetical protein